jgi:hypothetical protein
MKAKLVGPSTIVLLDGQYRYEIKKTGKGKEDFRIKKTRLEDDFDIFEETINDKEDEELEEDEEEKE